MQERNSFKDSEYSFEQAVADERVMEDLINSSAASKFKLPKLISLHLKSSCFNNCIFCGQQEHDPNCNPADIMDKISRYQKTNDTECLLIVGIEPLTFPGLIDIVKESSRMGFKRIEIMTSGNGLNQAEFTTNLVKAGATHFCIPLYGHREDLHDAITRTAGSFKAVMNGIQLLKDLGATVGISSLALKQNVAIMDELHDYVAADLHLPFFFGPVRMIVDAGPDGYKRVCPTLEDVFSHIKRATPFGFPLCMQHFGENNASGQTIEGLTQRAVSTVMGYLYFLYQPRTKHYEPCRKCALARQCPGVLQSYDEAFPVSAILNELSPY